MAKKKISKDINDRLDDIKAAIKTLQAEEKKLTKLGCVNASIQFKTNKPKVKGETATISNRMVLRHPVNGTDKRKVEYIGVDPVAQAEARARIDRYEQRRQIRFALDDLENQYSELTRDVSLLQDTLLSTVREATSVVRELC